MADATAAAHAGRFEVRVTADGHFAWLRTRLALERTMMAWLRTAVSLIGFGFAIVQFFEHMQRMPGVRPAEHPHAAQYMGLALISCGVLALVISVWQYWPVATQSVNEARKWADPLIAARYHMDFGRGLGLTAYGDVGGFGIAAHSDWQISGMLDYAWSPSLSFRAGYRSLNVNYQATGRPLGFNMHMKGPLLGLTMRF